MSKLVHGDRLSTTSLPSLPSSLPPYLEAGHAQQAVVLHGLEDRPKAIVKGLLGEVLVDACQEGQRLREGRGGRREGGKK